MSNSDWKTIVVFTGVLLRDEDRPEFVKFAKTELGVRLEYLDTYTTLPTPGEPDTGGRVDILCRVNPEDVPTYAINRMAHGDLRGTWWEDAVDNWGDIIPADTKAEYNV